MSALEDVVAEQQIALEELTDVVERQGRILVAIMAALQIEEPVPMPRRRRARRR